MFTPTLSATGALPATHYISSGPIYESLADLLPLTTVAYEEEDTAETTRPGNVEAVEAIATQAGFTLPPGTIAALFDAIDVTARFTAITLSLLLFLFVSAAISAKMVADGAVCGTDLL